MRFISFSAFQFIFENFDWRREVSHFVYLITGTRSWHRFNVSVFVCLMVVSIMISFQEPTRWKSDKMILFYLKMISFGEVSFFCQKHKSNILWAENSRLPVLIPKFLILRKFYDLVMCLYEENRYCKNKVKHINCQHPLVVWWVKYNTQVDTKMQNATPKCWLLIGCYK